jgi:transposase
MRRIIVATESSKLAQLCEEYWAFRKRQPLLLARIPQQIKLDAKSQLEAGVSIHELASKLGVQVGTLRGWMRSVGWSQTDVQTLTEPKTIEDAIKTLKSEYARLREPSLAPAQKRENTKKLGAMAKELIEFGSGVEEISKALGVHHMTVRLWLKSLQEKPESVETLERQKNSTRLSWKKLRAAPQNPYLWQPRRSNMSIRRSIRRPLPRHLSRSQIRWTNSCSLPILKVEPLKVASGSAFVSQARSWK